MNARHGALIGMLSAPTAAIACGVCIEDRVAATYDHAWARKAADGEAVGEARPALAAVLSSPAAI